MTTAQAKKLIDEGQVDLLSIERSKAVCRYNICRLNGRQDGKNTEKILDNSYSTKQYID